MEIFIDVLNSRGDFVRQVGLNVIGFEIDHSFLTYKKEAKEYGYEVGKISMKEKTVIFNKV